MSEKNVPVVQTTPFTTPYQLERFGKLVLTDRFRPYLLDKYSEADHFMVVTEPLSQARLFGRICDQLESEQLVEMGFRGSLHERERIVSTLLGEGIALPHSLGLLARRTLIYTVQASSGAMVRPPPSSSCSPSARRTTRRRWGSTICFWR
ncbi:PTS sugar transporter subunit IIA [Aeromonas media]|nr:PTS sugar transporter subunit IIA [Aeromonas media]